MVGLFTRRYAQLIAERERAAQRIAEQARQEEDDEQALHEARQRFDAVLAEADAYLADIEQRAGQ